MKRKFNVTGMSCSACLAHIEKSVGKLEGIHAVNVNLLANSMNVDFDEEKLSPESIVKTVEGAGYGASLQRAAESHADEATADRGEKGGGIQPVDEELSGMKRRLIISFVFLVPIFYISMGHMAGWPLPGFFHGPQNAITFAFTQFLLLLPIVYVNRKYFSVGFKALGHMAPNMDSLIAIGSAAAIVYGIFAIYKIGWGLGHGEAGVVIRYSMDLYFESAAMILALITLGKYFETKSKGRTSEAISKLMDLSPKTALVIREGAEQEIPASQVKIGDVVLAKPGQNIPVDGVILEGETTIDESALTGESMPVYKQPGDQVLSATLNQAGFFKFEAQKVGADTTLAKIIELVEEAGSSKAPIAKLADKVSGVFVPVVMAIALITAAAWLLLGYTAEFAVSSGIAVLVISCPCALGLATPVAIMVGTGKGAESGILVKSAEALETARLVDVVVLDKTGTITEGKPAVTDIILRVTENAEGIGSYLGSGLKMPRDGEAADAGFVSAGEKAALELENEFLTLAAAMEKPSEHPLGKAVVLEAQNRGLTICEVDSFTALPGRGIDAQILGKKYLAGNAQLMNENKIDLGPFAAKSNALAEQGKTPLYFADDRGILGMIAAADVARPTSKEAIEKFAAMGIEVIMLTGDNRRTAQAIGKQLGISKTIAEVLPQDKEAEIRTMKEAGKRVAMIGDGINDAPALMRADVGIAIGAAADIAVESADIVLMKSDLLDAVTAIELSKAVIRNVKQNLFWAFFYNALGIPLAAGVFYAALGWTLNPMFAAAAMSLSSVCVVTNALRLKFFKGRYGTAGHAEADNSMPMESIKEEKEENEIKERETKMKKTIMINGMMCAHCTGRVEAALSAIEGVEAVADLEKKLCTVELSESVDNETLTHAVNAAGYEVVGIK